LCFFFQAEDGIRDRNVTGVQTCALPIFQKTGKSLNLPLPGMPRMIFFSLGSMFLRKWMPPVIPWNLFKWMKLRPKELWKTRKFQIGRASCRERVEMWVEAVS